MPRGANPPGGRGRSWVVHLNAWCPHLEFFRDANSPLEETTPTKFWAFTFRLLGGSRPTPRKLEVEVWCKFFYPQSGSPKAEPHRHSVYRFNGNQELQTRVKLSHLCTSLWMNFPMNCAQSVSLCWLAVKLIKKKKKKSSLDWSGLPGGESIFRPAVGLGGEALWAEWRVQRAGWEERSLGAEEGGPGAQSGKPWESCFYCHLRSSRRRTGRVLRKAVNKPCGRGLWGPDEYKGFST